MILSSDDADSITSSELDRGIFPSAAAADNQKTPKSITTTNNNNMNQQQNNMNQQMNESTGAEMNKSTGAATGAKSNAQLASAAAAFNSNTNEQESKISIKELEVYMKTWLANPANANNLMPSSAQKDQIVLETGIEKNRLEGWFYR